MPKNTKTDTSRGVSSSKRSAVWKPTDIHRAGKARKKSPHSGGAGQSDGDSRFLPARPTLEIIAGNGGGHKAPEDHLAGASPDELPAPAEMPVGDVHMKLEDQSGDDVPTTDAAQAAGEDRAIKRPFTDGAEPGLPTTSAPRKRGRPRKANTASVPITDVSSSAPTTETPAETPVGDGQRTSANRLAGAVPINHSSDPAKNAVGDDRPMLALPDAATPREDQAIENVFPTEESPDLAYYGGDQSNQDVDPNDSSTDPATPSPAPKRGRQRNAELRKTPEHGVPSAAQTPARRGRLPRRTSIPSEPKVGLSDAAPSSRDPAEMPVGDGHNTIDSHGRHAVPAPDTTLTSVVSNDQASPAVSSDQVSPVVASSLPIGDDAAEDGAEAALTPEKAAYDLAPIVAELQELQKKRIFCIKSQMRQSSATLALLRTLLGWVYKGNETENAKINKRARELVKHVEVQDRLSKAVAGLSDMYPNTTDKQRRAAERELSLASNAADKLKPLEGRELEVSIHYRQVILASAQANAPWDILRDEYEQRMRDLVRDLPVFPWVSGVRGFAEIGLAKIIGEAGDLSKYDNPAKLWKRLGLAVINGRRQGDPGPGATAEDWTEHGYNPKRRSEIWNIADSLIRAVVRGAKEDPETGDLIDGYALSYYGEVYLARKAYETKKNENGDYANIAAAIVARSRGKVSPENLEGRLTKKHVDSRARRYVTKRLLKHLWQRWRNPTVPETDVHIHTDTA